jgi:hypothetical protein
MHRIAAFAALVVEKWWLQMVSLTIDCQPGKLVALASFGARYSTQRNLRGVWN